MPAPAWLALTILGEEKVKFSQHISHEDCDSQSTQVHFLFLSSAFKLAVSSVPNIPSFSLEMSPYDTPVSVFCSKQEVLFLPSVNHEKRDCRMSTVKVCGAGGKL